MIILKLLAPMLVFIIGIVQIFLEHKWYDKRVKAHKRIMISLIAIMFVATVVTILIVNNDHKIVSNFQKTIGNIKANSEKAIKQAEKREKIAKKERAELKSMLEPFIEIAIYKYPDIDTSLALSKLSKEIQEVRELATRDIYRPLASVKKQRLLIELRKLYKKYQSSLPTIKIFVQQSSVNRYKVCQDFVGYLNTEGFNAKIAGRGLFPQSAPPHAIEIHTNLKHKIFVAELFSVLSIWLDTRAGIAVRDSGNWKKESAFSEDEVQIYIYGRPLFNPEGVIKM